MMMQAFVAKILPLRVLVLQHGDAWRCIEKTIFSKCIVILPLPLHFSGPWTLILERFRRRLGG